MKIESNQPVKIEIPHLFHDLIWSEVSSFWSPSNKIRWLSLQEHYLCLLFLASSSSFFAFFQASISENFLPASWSRNNLSIQWQSWLFCQLKMKRKAVFIASLLFKVDTSLPFLLCVLFSMVSWFLLIPRVLWGICEELFLNQIWIRAISESPVFTTHQTVGKFMF